MQCEGYTATVYEERQQIPGQQISADRYNRLQHPADNMSIDQLKTRTQIQERFNDAKNVTKDFQENAGKLQ